MPILGIEPERILSRAQTIENAANQLLSSPTFSRLQFVFNPASAVVVAECYFALSEAYKGPLLPVGARTQPPKMAAFSAAAIGVVKPIRPPTLPIEDEEYLYVNGMLAMRVGCGFVRHNFNKRSFDDRRRWYKSVQGHYLPSLNPILEEANANEYKISQVYSISLSAAEIAELETLIEAFSLFQMLGEHDSSHR